MSTQPGRVNITQGPDGDPVVTPMTPEQEAELETQTTQADVERSPVGLVAGEDKITVKHTYCYVAGNQTQYTTVGVELVAQPGDDPDSLFSQANAIATEGVQIASDTLTEYINDKRARRAPNRT